MNPTLQQLLLTAQQHHQSGRFAEAESAYRQILQLSPDDLTATHFLGLLAFQTERVELGLELLSKSATAPSAPPEFLFNYALALDQLGRWPESLPLYQRAIELRPDYPDALVNLAACLAKFHRFEEGIDLCQRALALRPGWPTAQFNLAQCLKGRALSLHFTGSPSQAVPLFRQALALRPDDSELSAALAIALCETDDHDAALATVRNPSSPATHWARGFALERTGKLDEAMASYRAALSPAPDTQQVERAVHWCRDAVALNPANLTTLVSIAQTLAQDPDAGDDAAAACARMLHKNPAAPNPAWALSNRLLSLHYAMPLSPQGLFREHTRLARLYELSPPLSQPRIDLSPSRILRIAYLSGDFWTHSVAYFIEPLLDHHDRSRFAVFCYATSATVDETTRRLQSYPVTWRCLAGLSDADAAQLIRNDRIDILIDLSGHTANNRLALLALKPAPIQVTYLGYPNTTGLSRIDYRLTDAIADPPGTSDAFHTEKLIRLPSAWCYRPPLDVPSSAPRAKDDITFGSFNTALKLVPATIDLWAKLVSAVPNSRLLLKSAGLSEPSTARRILNSFESSGIPRSRIDLLGRTRSHADHFAAYNRIDIALDTFSYNGTTTTLEALWMGVPVISLAGDVHASRVGASLLTTAGLPELIARDPDAFVRIAIDLASDPARRAEIRAKLRARLLASPLLDARAFTLELERRFSKMWADFLAGDSPRASQQ